MRRCLLLMLFVVATVTHASDELTAHITRQAEQVDALSGEFQQTKHISVLPLPLISTGNFVYDKGTGLKWITVSPVQSELHISQAGIESSADSATSDSAVSKFIAKLFLGLFAGDLQILEHYFVVSTSGESVNWRMQLTPKSDDVAAQISTIQLSGTHAIESIHIQEANGDSTQITLDYQATPNPHP